MGFCGGFFPFSSCLMAIEMCMCREGCAVAEPCYCVHSSTIFCQNILELLDQKLRSFARTKIQHDYKQTKLTKASSFQLPSTQENCFNDILYLCNGKVYQKDCMSMNLLGAQLVFTECQEIHQPLSCESAYSTASTSIFS